LHLQRIHGGPAAAWLSRRAPADRTVQP